MDNRRHYLCDNHIHSRFHTILHPRPRHPLIHPQIHQPEKIRKMDNPKVSVIVPIYNVEKYIERCARSLFEQTLDSIEYIFVNDCTPDNSMVILNQVIADYPNRKDWIKIINRSENKGLPQARKLGIEAATGEYIIHCDSDDWVDTDMYRAMYTHAVDTNSDMVCCNSCKTDGATAIEVKQKLDNCDKKYLLCLLVSRTFDCSLCNKLCKSQTAKSISVFPTENMMEDVAITLQMLYNCKKITYIPKAYYYYFNNSESICNKDNEESAIKRCHQAVANIDICIDFLKAKGCIEQYTNELVKLKNSARVFLWHLLMSNPKKYYKLWLSVYPEINWKYPFTKGINIRLRVIFLLTTLRIYPFIYKLSQ